MNKAARSVAVLLVAVAVGSAWALGGLLNFGSATDTRSTSDDQEVRVGGFLGDVAADTLPVEEVGDVAYDLQEGTHEALNDTTGVSVDYYYLWICTGDECIPADPYKFTR